MSRSEEEILEEMLRWLRFTGMQEARDVIDDALTNEDEDKEHDKRIAYELTDGTRSQRNIAEHISFSYRTVGRWQEQWAKLGIIDKRDGNYEHLIALEDLGLNCPPIPNPDEEDTEETEETQTGEEKEDEELDEGEQATLNATTDDDS